MIFHFFFYLIPIHHTVVSVFDFPFFVLNEVFEFSLLKMEKKIQDRGMIDHC